MTSPDAARWKDGGPRKLLLTDLETGVVHAKLKFQAFKAFSECMGQFELLQASRDFRWPLIVIGSAVTEAPNIGKVKWAGS